MRVYSNGDNTIDKVMAEHKLYKRPLMLALEKDADPARARFMTVKHIEQTNRNELDQVFRLESMSEY